MVYIQIGLQIVIALGIFNVWLLRYSKSSSYRGGGAGNIEEEFAVYGLPKWMFYLVGLSKVSCAVALILGLWMNAFVLPAAALLALLMVGAIGMHIKVKDSFAKSIPAVAMLGMCLVLVFLV
jgi:uncharacterized membrane protein YphA (DoxX/SURF4 family)